MATIDIEYAAEQERLEELLESVDRPGGFCTSSRAYLPMPTVEVEGAGTLSFPVPVFQIRDLLKVAERAPYGKGADTLVDTSVRDCWQIGAERIRVGGAHGRKPCPAFWKGRPKASAAPAGGLRRNFTSC